MGTKTAVLIPLPIFSWHILKQQLCTSIMLFCTFLCRRCTTPTWNYALISRFVEDRNRRQLSFSLLLSKVSNGAFRLKEEGPWSYISTRYSPFGVSEIVRRNCTWLEEPGVFISCFSWCNPNLYTAYLVYKTYLQRRLEDVFLLT